MSHAYPIQILRDAVERLTHEAAQHSAVAEGASAKRDEALAHIKVAEAAIDHLLKSGPGVEHSPAPEEGRLTFERGWRVRVKGFGALEDGTEVEVMDVAAVGRDLYRVKTLGVSGSQWNVPAKNLIFHSEGLKASTAASRLAPGTRVRVDHPSVPDGTTASVIEGGTGDRVAVRLHGRDQNVYGFAASELTPLAEELTGYPLLKDGLTRLIPGNTYMFHREGSALDKTLVTLGAGAEGMGWVVSGKFKGAPVCAIAKLEELA